MRLAALPLLFAPLLAQAATLSVCWSFGEGTFAGKQGNGRDAPKPDLYAAAGERASFELCG